MNFYFFASRVYLDGIIFPLRWWQYLFFLSKNACQSILTLLKSQIRLCNFCSGNILRSTKDEMTDIHKFPEDLSVFSVCGICYILTNVVMARNLLVVLGTSCFSRVLIYYIFTIIQYSDRNIFCTIGNFKIGKVGFYDPSFLIHIILRYFYCNLLVSQFRPFFIWIPITFMYPHLSSWCLLRV
jgi:hypothetical protein